MAEPRPAPRRFRASIGEVMGLVALTGLVCARPALIPTAFVVIFLWTAAHRGPSPARDQRVALGIVLAAVFLPPLVSLALAPWLAPLLGEGPSWPEWWSSFITIAPGLLLGLIVETMSGLGRFLARRSPGLAIDAAYGLASLATAVEVYALTRVACRSRRHRAVVGVVGLLGSAVSTYVTMIFSGWLGAV